MNYLALILQKNGVLSYPGIIRYQMGLGDDGDSHGMRNEMIASKQRERKIEYGNGQRITPLVLCSEGDWSLLRHVTLSLSLLRYFTARKAGTPATVIRRSAGPHQALQPSRSYQLQRRCERTARGERSGGEVFFGMSGSGTISTCCLRQWVIHVRRSIRPATSTHCVAARIPCVSSTDEGAGKRRRTALTRRARFPLAFRARHCSRRGQHKQSSWRAT